eukprot:9394169-Lingulodinium_polyedra.AAC.1
MRQAGLEVFAQARRVSEEHALAKKRRDDALALRRSVRAELIDRFSAHVDGTSPLQCCFQFWAVCVKLQKGTRA